jgi:hypothetical protein
MMTEKHCSDAMSSATEGENRSDVGKSKCGDKYSGLFIACDCFSVDTPANCSRAVQHKCNTPLISHLTN